MALIRLMDMEMKPVYVRADSITMVRRGSSTMPSNYGQPCTDVFTSDADEPIEVRTSPSRIAKLVREATSWVELR